MAVTYDNSGRVQKPALTVANTPKPSPILEFGRLPAIVVPIDAAGVECVAAAESATR